MRVRIQGRKYIFVWTETSSSTRAQQNTDTCLDSDDKDHDDSTTCFEYKKH